MQAASQLQGPGCLLAGTCTACAVLARMGAVWRPAQKGRAGQDAGSGMLRRPRAALRAALSGMLRCLHSLQAPAVDQMGAAACAASALCAQLHSDAGLAQALSWAWSWPPARQRPRRPHSPFQRKGSCSRSAPAAARVRPAARKRRAQPARGSRPHRGYRLEVRPGGVRRALEAALEVLRGRHVRGGPAHVKASCAHGQPVALHLLWVIRDELGLLWRRCGRRLLWQLARLGRGRGEVGHRLLLHAQPWDGQRLAALQRLT